MKSPFCKGETKSLMSWSCLKESMWVNVIL
jgi:hypothetical protein